MVSFLFSLEARFSKRRLLTPSFGLSFFSKLQRVSKILGGSAFSLPPIYREFPSFSLFICYRVSYLYSPSF